MTVCWHVEEIGCEKCDPHMSRPRTVTIGPADSTGPLPTGETSSTMAGKADIQAVMLSLVDTLEKDRNAWREKAVRALPLEAQIADLEFRLREVVRERDEAYADRSRARADRDQWKMRAGSLLLVLKEYYHECRCNSPEIQNANQNARQLMGLLEGDK